jgi:hypothetical protein
MFLASAFQEIAERGMASGGWIALLSLEGTESAQESAGRFEGRTEFERRGMPADGQGMRLRGAALPLRRAL